MGIAPPALRERERVRSHRSDLPAGHNIPRVFGRYDNRLITSQYRPNASYSPPTSPLVTKRFSHYDSLRITRSFPAICVTTAWGGLPRNTSPPYTYEEPSRSDFRKNFGRSHTREGIDAPTRLARLTQWMRVRCVPRPAHSPPHPSKCVTQDKYGWRMQEI